MGTNYYLKSPGCPSCGHSKDKLHIGKSSYGWCFALHVYPDGAEWDDNLVPIVSLDEWQKLWLSGVIWDEYGKPLRASEMIDIIVNRRGPERKLKGPPGGVIGPHNLYRHEIGNGCCIGYGEGTWDLLAGWFS